MHTLYYVQGHNQAMLSLAVNNSVVLDTIVRLSKNKNITACMHKNSSTPSKNTALWHYLGIKHLYFRHESNSTPGVLIEETWYLIHEWRQIIMIVDVIQITLL